MNGHALRELARAIAVVAHDGQSRKGAGEPYMAHVDAVADAVWGWRAKTLAYLHDVIEDAADPTHMKLVLVGLFPADIVIGVVLLSRLPGKDGVKITYAEFIDDIATCGDEDVVAVKREDIRHNLKDITDIPNGEGLQRRYFKALARLEDS